MLNSSNINGRTLITVGKQVPGGNKGSPLCYVPLKTTATLNIQLFPVSAESKMRSVATGSSGSSPMSASASASYDSNTSGRSYVTHESMNSQPPFGVTESQNMLRDSDSVSVISTGSNNSISSATDDRRSVVVVTSTEMITEPLELPLAAVDNTSRHSVAMSLSDAKAVTSYADAMTSTSSITLTNDETAPVGLGVFDLRKAAVTSTSSGTSTSSDEHLNEETSPVNRFANVPPSPLFSEDSSVSRQSSQSAYDAVVSGTDLPIYPQSASDIKVVYESMQPTNRHSASSIGSENGNGPQGNGLSTPGISKVTDDKEQKDLHGTSHSTSDVRSMNTDRRRDDQDPETVEPSVDKYANNNYNTLKYSTFRFFSWDVMNALKSAAANHGCQRVLVYKDTCIVLMFKASCDTERAGNDKRLLQLMADIAENCAKRLSLMQTVKRPNSVAEHIDTLPLNDGRMTSEHLAEISDILNEEISITDVAFRYQPTDPSIYIGSCVKGKVASGHQYSIGSVGVVAVLTKKNKYATVDAFSEQLCEHITRARPSELGSFDGDRQAGRVSQCRRRAHPSHDVLLLQSFTHDPTIIVAEAARRCFVSIDDFLLFD